MYSQNNRSINWLSFQEAKDQLGDPLSSFVLFRCKRHMVLPPQYLGKIKNGVREQLDAELKLYCDRLQGVLVAYDNISILQRSGTIHDEEPSIHFDIEADFIVFRPNMGSSLKGVVNKVSRDHIGCLVHGCFNASIPKPRNTGNTWQDVSMVTTGVELEFEVAGLSNHNRILSVHGTLKSHSLQHLHNASRKEKRKLSYSGSRLNAGANNRVENSDSRQPTMDSQHQKAKKKRKKHDEMSCTPNSISETESPISSSKKKKKRKDKVNLSVRNPAVSEQCVNNNSHTTVSSPPEAKSEGKFAKKKKHKERDSDCIDLTINEPSYSASPISTLKFEVNLSSGYEVSKKTAKPVQNSSPTETITSTSQNSSGLFDSGIDMSAFLPDLIVPKAKSKKRKRIEETPKYDGSSENESVLVFQETILPGSSLIEFNNNATDSQESDTTLTKKHKKKNRHKDGTVRT